MSSHDPFDIESEVAAAAAKEVAAKLSADLDINDFKWLMSSKRGRRIVWRLVEQTGMFRSSFTGDNDTFFREGARNVGLMLMAKVNDHCAAEYVLMLNERKDWQ